MWPSERATGRVMGRLKPLCEVDSLSAEWKVSPQTTKSKSKTLIFGWSKESRQHETIMGGMFIPPGFYVGSLTPVEFMSGGGTLHFGQGGNPNSCAVWSPRPLRMEEPTRGFTEERDCVLDVISAALDQTAANNPRGHTGLDALDENTWCGPDFKKSSVFIDDLIQWIVWLIQACWKKNYTSHHFWERSHSKTRQSKTKTFAWIHLWIGPASNFWGQNQGWCN